MEDASLQNNNKKTAIHFSSFEKSKSVLYSLNVMQLHSGS